MYKITSKFLQQEGFRSSSHKGIDFSMPNGTPLKSIRDGICHIRDYGNTNAGKTALVEWEDGKTAVYGHLSDFAVKEGQRVSAGELIGYSGNSGFVQGANGGYHLHFGLKENGQFIDPSPYVSDIQNMNSTGEILKQVADTKINFVDYFQQHMDLIGNQLIDLKANFINFLILSDYSPFIQLLKNIVQFIFFNI